MIIFLSFWVVSVCTVQNTIEDITIGRDNTRLDFYIRIASVLCPLGILT
jgi:hypothetical protein